MIQTSSSTYIVHADRDVGQDVVKFWHLSEGVVRKPNALHVSIVYCKITPLKHQLNSDTTPAATWYQTRQRHHNE